MTMSLWISGLLLISITGTHGLSRFPENFVVAKMNDAKPVILTCGTEEPVTWKHGDHVLEDYGDDIIQHEGQNLSFSDVDSPILGEYSCWAGEKMISSTYLLLEAQEEEDLDSLISCWANSYNCNFTCNWNDTRYSVRLGLGPECTEGGKSCHWVSSYDRLQGGGFQFVLSHSLSPYAEESTMLELTAQAILNHSIHKIKKMFYLRDIIRPDSPKIVTWQDVGQELKVTIEPPSTWSTPLSFFRLEHEIEYIRKHDGKVGRSLSALIPKGIVKMRVRSRDLLVPLNWSEWTLWKNVTQ
nr:interleukin-12 subunit beta [Solea senegalensis]